jgi:hypothetical protein
MKKFLVFIACFILFALQSNGQAFQWAEQFEGSTSYGTDIVTDNNFNVISAGWYSDSIDLDPGPGAHWVNNGSANSFQGSYLSKLDQNGTFVWGYSFNDSSQYSFNRIYDIDVDNQNNILVMGQFRDSIDLDFGLGSFKLYDPHNNNNSSYYDNIFIAKYDPNGNLLWGKGLHSTSTISSYGLWGNGLKVDGSNNVLVTGRFHDTVDFDPGPGVYNVVGTNITSSTFNGNKFLLKLTSSGNFTWVRDWENSGAWGNNGLYGSNELDVDANDNIFFPIVFIDSFDTNPLLPIDMVYSNGSRDISLLKVSPNGSLVWHKEIGGSSHDYCHSLATDPSGNIFYALQLYGNVPIDLDPGPGVFLLNTSTNFNWEKVILKLDNNGNFIWALKNLDQNWGGWTGDGLATDTAGGVYLTSRIPLINNTLIDLNPGPNVYMVSGNGSLDVVFQNLDNNGNFVWGGIMGGPSSDFNFDICTDHARGVYLTGRFVQTADFDPTPNTAFMTSSSSFDPYIVKLNNCNVTRSEIHQACDSVIFNNQVFYTDTAFQSHYPAWNGCDSAHAIVIDIKTFTDDTIKVDACKFYFWNANTYTSSGLYTHNYGLPNGCDSMVTIDLTIHQGSVQTVNFSDCDSVLFNGITYYETGQYQQIYASEYGCDSNFIINFVNTNSDTSITVQGLNSLSANATSATYQWIDCATLLPIPGATFNTFSANQSGQYACVVTQNGCADTSSCYSLTVAPNSIKEYNINARISPNPSTGTYYLMLDKIYKNVHLELRSLSGQLLWNKNYEQLKETDFHVNKAVGVYMLKISVGEKNEVIRLLKW